MLNIIMNIPLVRPDQIFIVIKEIKSNQSKYLELMVLYLEIHCYTLLSVLLISQTPNSHFVLSKARYVLV